jgi:hypothetical protein
MLFLLTGGANSLSKVCSSSTSRISLQDVDEQDVFTVSGLNSASQPVSIEWTCVGGETVDGVDANNITTYATGSCMPIQIVTKKSTLLVRPVMCVGMGVKERWRSLRTSHASRRTCGIMKWL